MIRFQVIVFKFVLLYGPRFARSVPERPWAIFSQYVPSARLIRSKCIDNVELRIMIMEAKNSGEPFTKTDFHSFCQGQNPSLNAI